MRMERGRRGRLGNMAMTRYKYYKDTHTAGRESSRIIKENIVKTCDVCQEYQPKQQKELLQPHVVPSTPWTKLASNLFTLNREDYLFLSPDWLPIQYLKLPTPEVKR